MVAMVVVAQAQPRAMVEMVAGLDWRARTEHRTIPHPRNPVQAVLLGLTPSTAYRW
jgi:hypothetical protein